MFGMIWFHVPSFKKCMYIYIYINNRWYNIINIDEMNYLLYRSVLVSLLLKKYTCQIQNFY